MPSGSAKITELDAFTCNTLPFSVLTVVTYRGGRYCLSPLRPHRQLVQRQFFAVDRESVRIGNKAEVWPLLTALSSVFWSRL